MSSRLAFDDLGGWFPFLINKLSDVDQTDGPNVIPIDLYYLMKLWWHSKSFDYIFDLSYSFLSAPFGSGYVNSDNGSVLGSGTVQCSADGIVPSEPWYERVSMRMGPSYLGRQWPMNNTGGNWAAPADPGFRVIPRQVGIYTSYNEYTGDPTVLPYSQHMVGPPDIRDGIRMQFFADLFYRGAPPPSFPESGIIMAYGGVGTTYYTSLYLFLGIASNVAPGLALYSIGNSQQNFEGSYPMSIFPSTSLILKIAGQVYTLPLYVLSAVLPLPNGSSVSGTITIDFNNFWST